MGIMDFIRPVATMTADQVREFLRDKDAGDYNLIDVRQQLEYKRGHIPGARLIPVGELQSRAHELDPHKPVITY